VPRITNPLDREQRGEPAPPLYWIIPITKGPNQRFPVVAFRAGLTI
jgi:hypothetical protein